MPSVISVLVQTHLLLKILTSSESGTFEAKCTLLFDLNSSGFYPVYASASANLSQGVGTNASIML